MLSEVQGEEKSYDYVHVECPSCKDGVDDHTFHGELGKDIVLKYIINETALHLLTLTYNETSVIKWSQSILKVDKINDARIEAKQTSDSPHVLEVTIRHLTMADDGATFKYDSRNTDLHPAKGENTIKIVPAKIFSGSEDNTRKIAILFYLYITQFFVGNSIFHLRLELLPHFGK